MAYITYNTSSVFGMGKIKDLLFFPAGRMRVRMRPNRFVKVYIKTNDGLRVFTVKEEGDYWRPCLELGLNTTRHNQ